MPGSETLTTVEYREALRPLRTEVLLVLLDELLLRQLRGYQPIYRHPTDLTALAHAAREWSDVARHAHIVMQELQYRAQIAADSGIAR